MNTADIDTTNMCSHLRHKLMDADGIYHKVWQTIQDEPELTAVVRSRQLHIYRNGKKVLVLKGKADPQIVREDPIDELINQ
ncbi:hypothetical protein [Prevotella sp. AGR2160]|uniref:hypothetical protein n=1 Tax=Prevotella sp. AGR2160 TaxID=1280674 RepID=UPI00048E419B|nr:hypothetical protein [Prevotella sp. AGR2160]